MRKLALAALAVSLAAPASASASRLHGIVTKGPTRPVCLVDDPCSAPAASVRLSFLGGGVVRAVTTDAGGRYAVSLPAGTYRVVVAGGRFGWTPTLVVVRPGTSARRDFELDTGIR